MWQPIHAQRGLPEEIFRAIGNCAVRYFGDLDPSGLHVKIDFNQGRLPEELIRADFQRSRAAVFLWEGVTNYLTVEAVDAVLRCVASCGPGSQIIFTYVHSGILDGSVCFEGGDRLLRDLARLGERWTFGL